MTDNTLLQEKIKSSLDMEKEAGAKTLITIKDYDFYYGSNQVLFDVNMEIPEKQIVSFIGPSGCGKSTLLRNINRMNDLVDGIHHKGDIVINGQSNYDPHLDVISLRRRVGMVFQKSNPFF